jgi:hypothetical protein
MNEELVQQLLTALNEGKTWGDANIERQFMIARGLIEVPGFEQYGSDMLNHIISKLKKAAE